MAAWTNLGESATSFVGRERERDVLAALLARARLVTLVGAAGMGKTRLAREVALGEAARFPGGVWFCDVSGAEDSRELVVVVARTLRTRLADEEGTEASSVRVADAIARRGRTLLLLDNFEQIEPQGALVVARWVEHAADAVFVATSRQPLRVQAEHRLELWGLGPGDGGVLFAERAMALRPARPFDDVERAASERIAARLDGNPLAIELAAGRSALLTASEIDARLEHEVDLLHGGARDAPARHASLGAALDASLRLLASAEREALVQCGVFRGGFTVADAEDVLDLSAQPGAPAVLAALEALRERSLLAPHDDDAAGARRFRLLVSVRQHVAEHIDASTRRRHAAYFLARFEAHAAELSGDAGASRGDRQGVLDRAERDLDDTVAAFRWALADDDPSSAARLALALDEVLTVAGPFPTRAIVLEDATRALATSGDARRASRLLVARGIARLDAGRYAEATGDLEEAVSIAEREGDLALEARARLSLGNVSLWQGHWGEARARYVRALACSRAAGAAVVTSKVSNNLAMIASGRGERDEAVRLYAEALESGRRVGDRGGRVLVNLAQLHHQAGDLVRARIDLDEAERSLASGAERFYECFTLICRAWLSIEELDLRDAEADLTRARSLLAAMGSDARLEGLLLATDGVLAAIRDRLEVAESALRAARSVLTEMGDRACLDALAALEGFLDLARARAAGRPDVAEAHAGEARRRLDELVRRDRAGEVLLSETRVPMRLLERALADRAAGRGRCLEVASDGRWFRLGKGARCDLSRRRAVRRLFASLIERRLAEPGSPLALEELIALAWPGERMTPQSATHRAYVSIHALRRLGLEGVLVTCEGGYMLDPDVSVVRIAE